MKKVVRARNKSRSPAGMTDRKARAMAKATTTATADPLWAIADPLWDDKQKKERATAPTTAKGLVGWWAI
jgi:hypothetical protein